MQLPTPTPVVVEEEVCGEVETLQEKKGWEGEVEVEARMFGLAQVAFDGKAEDEEYDVGVFISYSLSLALCPGTCLVLELRAS